MPKLTVRCCRIGLALVTAGSLPTVLAQTDDYRLAESWAKLPSHVAWGPVVALDVDRDGDILALHRCGAETCIGRSEPPILEFDADGRFLRSWGAGMFVWPHGLHIDREGSVWVSDGRGDDAGRGQQVFKFSPAGEVLLTLGVAGEPGEDERHLNGPTDIAVAPNGDVFVADGHGNNRVVKYNSRGEYVTSWGRLGSGPGEFEVPHAIAIDARGRVLVGDRDNGRIQLFDQNGRFLAQWTQFGAPSGFHLVDGEMLYVAHAEGVRFGRTADGQVLASISHTAFRAEAGNVEDVAADRQGHLYAGLASPWLLQKLERVR